MSYGRENAGDLQRQWAEAGAESLASLSSGLQVIAAAAGELAQRSLAIRNDALEKLLSAGTPEDAVAAQTAYLRQAYEDVVAGAGRLTELYADLARDTVRPFEAARHKAG